MLQVSQVQNLQNNLIISNYTQRRRVNQNNLERIPKTDSLQISFKSAPLVNELLADIAHVPKDIWSYGALIKNPQVWACIERVKGLPEHLKKVFVKEYCAMTGFPDMAKITENIDKAIVDAVNNLSESRGVKPLFVAYDSNNSVARNRAIPGGDCDSLLYVIDKYDSNFEVNRASIGNNMNQRLLETTGSAFPELFPLENLIQAIREADEIFQKNGLFFKIPLYRDNLLYSGESFVKAGEFNIDIAKYAKDKEQRNRLCQASMFAEKLRAGKVLVNNLDKDILDRIKNSAMYKYGNVMRQEGLKHKLKDKLSNRIDLCQEFIKADDDKKFEICVGLIERSFGVENPLIKKSDRQHNMGDIISFYKKISTYFG